MTVYILVACKNDQNLALVRRATQGLDCHLVLSTTISLALFLAQKNKPALIISDLTLADGDGASFIQEVKSDKELKAIPFIFLLEEKADDALKQTLLSYGAARVISRADDQNELVKIISSLVNQ